MHNPLAEVISRKVRLSQTDVELITHSFELVAVPKATVMEESDHIPRHMYFIVSGVLRLFYLSDNGEEVTSHLAAPNKFLTSFLAFIHQKKSKEAMATVTDCDLYRILRADMLSLINDCEPFKQFSTVIFEEAITATENRANDLATLNGEQRYKKLMQTQPEILQQVPMQYIASYLGIKPQSLSRIRRRLIT